MALGYFFYKNEEVCIKIMKGETLLKWGIFKILTTVMKMLIPANKKFRRSLSEVCKTFASISEPSYQLLINFLFTSLNLL